MRIRLPAMLSTWALFPADCLARTCICTAPELDIVPDPDVRIEVVVEALVGELVAAVVGEMVVDEMAAAALGASSRHSRTLSYSYYFCYNSLSNFLTTLFPCWPSSIPHIPFLVPVLHWLHLVVVQCL